MSDNTKALVDTKAPTKPTERRTFGTLRLRGHTWWARYRVDGKEHAESLHTTSRREAEKKLAVIEDHIGRGEHQHAEARRMTFGELETLILTDYRTRKLRSLPRLNTALAHLRGTFGSSRALSITTDRIVAYGEERVAQGAAQASVNCELAALRRMFRLAIKARRLSSAPSITIHDPQNARLGYFEPDDAAAVFKEMPDYLVPAMRFAYLSGWRTRSEVLPLTWDRVDLVAGIIRLDPNTTKNGEGRSLPYSALPQLAAIIEAQRAATTALERATSRIIPNVFHHVDGRPIKSYKNAWSRAVERAARGGSTEPLAAIVRPQLIGRIVHDFRRTAVRNLEGAGVSRSVAMKLTGHKTEAVYRRYAITSAADLRDGLGKLAEHLNPKRVVKGQRKPKGTEGGQSRLRAVAGGKRS